MIPKHWAVFFCMAVVAIVVLAGPGREFQLFYLGINDLERRVEALEGP